MRLARSLLGVALVAGLAAPGAALAQRDTNAVGRGGEARSDGPERRNWLETAERTPEGGFRIGNPNARVKVVEYLSLTCSHCAAFTHQAGEKLFGDYVGRGVVSVEYRNYVLNGYDLAAAVLSRCASPLEYFDVTHAFLGSQREWLGRANAITDAQRTELSGLQPLQVVQRLSGLLGLETIASRHGISAAEARACLANEAGLQEVDRMLQAASAAGVNGTPTFSINGNMLNVNTWPEIESLLRQAAG